MTDKAEWQDIASAPRDGTQFIGLTKAGRAVTARWREYAETWKQNLFGAWTPDRTRSYFEEVGFQTSGERDFTHWMPLVLPQADDPASAASRQEKMLDLSKLSGGPNAG